MAGLKPPKIGDKLVPVFTDDELAALLGTCKGGGFQNRRDYAIISLFKDTGARLSELAGLTTGDISPRDREAVGVYQVIKRRGLDAGVEVNPHKFTVAALGARRRSGNITSLRDNALITIGRSYAEINAALLAACNAATLAESGSPLAASWGCAVKAYGVDAAYRAVSELALLAGPAASSQAPPPPRQSAT
jgi:site-specific recombinase XerC